MYVANPILRGWHPDPSICRVGKTSYIATSTFEWFPGIAVHASEDLAHWRLAARPLQEKQLDLSGVPDSGGVWAPSLTYADGRFWLVYSVVCQLEGIFKDIRNYLVTANRIEGPWSKPVELSHSGFDPSLFHDEDGRKYLLNMYWDYRFEGQRKFHGIVMQEYDEEKQCLVGPRRRIFTGSATGGTEGPTVLKKDGYYYLFVAEGGTGRHHSLAVARSRDIWGPYAISPHHPLLTSFHHPEARLRKSGHGNPVQMEDGRWYVVHLCTRYEDEAHDRRSPLGRETALQEIIWQDGWPQLVSGTNAPEDGVTTSLPSVVTDEAESAVRTFGALTAARLDEEFYGLRRSWREMADTEVRPGWLRVYGGDSLSSLFRQSLIARKWQSLDFTAETHFEFCPHTYQNLAGLVFYYHTHGWIYAYASRDEASGQRILNLLVQDNGVFTEPLRSCYIYLPEEGAIGLRAEVYHGHIQFFYCVEGGAWYRLGPALDGNNLSDDHLEGAAYSGAMTGISVIDVAGGTEQCFADFASFSYQEESNHEDELCQ